MDSAGQGHSAKAQLQRESAVQHPRIYPHITQCYAFAVRYYRGVAREGLRVLEHPLSCRAMTSYEPCIATHVVTLASCKLKFTVLELCSSSYYTSYSSTQHGFTPALFRARGKDRTFSQRPIVQRSPAPTSAPPFTESWLRPCIT